MYYCCDTAAVDTYHITRNLQQTLYVWHVLPSFPHVHGRA